MILGRNQREILLDIDSAESAEYVSRLRFLFGTEERHCKPVLDDILVRSDKRNAREGGLLLSHNGQTVFSNRLLESNIAKIFNKNATQVKKFPRNSNMINSSPR